MLRPTPLRLLPAAILVLGLLPACPSDPGTCTEGQVKVNGQCVTGTCVPGESRCDGPLVQTCLEDASGFGASTACDPGQLCWSGACTEAAACQAEDPPCCSQQSDCGTETQPNACEECRPIVRDAYCEAASCVAVPSGLVRFTVVLKAEQLTPTEANGVSSAVVTFYDATTADGRPVTCEMLLAEDADGQTPHDAKDPSLNVFVSAMANVQFPMGYDAFSLEVPNVPTLADQVIVASVYRFTNAAGPRLARACTEQVTPVDGGKVQIQLQPEG